MLFSPHEGHFQLVHGLIYEALFLTVGLRSYLPYLAVMLAAHWATVVLLFLVVRRRAGDVLALGAAALLLVYGTAAEDLAWAFQIGFILPGAFGLAALWLLDEPTAGSPRIALAALCLTLGIATSAMGVVMYVAVAAEIVLDRSRWRFVPALVAPAAVFALWYLLVARFVPSTLSFGPQTLEVFPQRFYVGLEGVAGGIFGLQLSTGVAAICVVTAFLVYSWVRRRRIGSRAIGPLIGIVVEFALIGLARANFDLQSAASSRYMYIAAILLLLALTDATSTLPVRWPLVVPLAAVLILSIWLNAHLLATFAYFRSFSSVNQSVELRTLEAYRGARDTTPNDQVNPVITPITPRQYYDATSAWGSPVPTTAQPQLASLDPAFVDRALTALFANGLAPSGASDQTQCRSGSTHIDATPGSVVLVVPDAESKADYKVWAMDSDTMPPSAETDSVITLRLQGDRLPNALGIWHVSVAGGAACTIQAAVP